MNSRNATLIRHTSELSGVPEDQVRNVFEALVLVVTRELLARRRVTIRNLGSLWVYFRKGCSVTMRRMGKGGKRDATASTIVQPDAYHARFTPSKTMNNIIKKNVT